MQVWVCDRAAWLTDSKPNTFSCTWVFAEVIFCAVGAKQKPYTSYQRVAGTVRYCCFTWHFQEIDFWKCASQKLKICSKISGLRMI